jgi:eukaryotic-like serine/threonine-protein kinase
VAVESASLALAVGTRIDDYVIVSPLGAGGMGEVYRARDAKLGRDVALKLLPSALASDAERLARFDREAKLLASLNHPGIAHLYGFETATLENGTKVPVLVMELVEGEDLAARLKRGVIPVDEALAIARQVAEALEEAHEKGIVHRDLKPGNVKVTPGGQVKVLDFGLAKAWSGDAATGSSSDLSQSPTLARTGTEAGLILGTAAYMSPEQARGKPVDRRTDIWAFGVLLFEMLTGRKLFDGETVTDVLASVVKDPIRHEALPASTPAAVRRLLARCLERNPRRRLRDIGEARLALEEKALADEPAGTAPAAPRSWLARGLPWVFAAAAVAVAAWALSRTGAGTAATQPVVHLDVAFPPGVEPMGGRQGGIAIAPDGSTIAMVGFKDGQRRLFVRRLDAPDAVDLTNTSGGGVFSPDSASVAVVSNATAVSRVSLADGRFTTLATGGDFVSGVNLAWGPKDVFFVRNGTIWSVPAEGGTARQLTSLDAASDEALHTDPLALPGGRRVLFSRLTTEPGGDRIEAIPVEGGPRKVVVENATTPEWSPTGHLLFARGAAVWAVPFDPATATALGTAIPVIPAGVIGPVRAGSLGFEVSTNGTLVFVPVNFDNKRFVSVDRDGAELPLPLPPGRYGNPRLSPDGRRVAIDRDGSLIESLDLERGTHAVIVPAGVGVNFVIWTSDGAKLVFRRLNAAFWAAADGSGKTGRVPHGDANTSPASAGPDSSTFIGIRLMPETAGDLYLMSVTGAFPPKPVVETRAYEGSPHLSPDGRWLLYQSNASGRPEIFVRRYPEGDRAWQVSEGGGVQVRWSPTGREVFYRGGGRIMAVAFDGKGPEPVLGKPQGLFADVYDFGQGLSIPNYDVTRDGRFLMLRRSTEGGTLRVVLNWTEELKRTLAQGGAR